MRIRKIISLLIVSLLLASNFGVYADNDNLNAIGITTNLLSGEADGFISRAEFAYLVSKMMTGEDMQPIKTKFVDVNEKNVYSGYVAFLNSQGIINGVSETEYAPDLNVTKAAAAKIVSKVLGYSADGSDANDYLLVAEKLGIFNDVYVGGEYITRKDAFKILEN
ncbi:MAG: S-layer homology domain-containing protein, partial [Clostridia bacterium]|nr:S-layer homology domain-containing protein [Clostridia bacterium]